ncbi:hypothetical protein RND81_02G228600 [Saponaria officinalis]|uniref:Protein WVD2-like 7 n=1 Tax=Saponaria officinalis TaxID=3572 RepID=A0AAW1MZP5_SAPOF
MGEPLVETPKVDYKMGETVTNLACLQQSVSFGRFEHDSLCWERWSTFPSNKYLEEVEKCSTPGSVAQKKAYFEAHYKKIAARRAELLVDQDREREADEIANHEDSASTSLVYEKADIENSVCTTDQLDDEVGSFDGDMVIEHVSVINDSAGVFNQENDVGLIDGEVGGFDGDTIFEHVSVINDSAGVFNQENDVGRIDGEVIVEHVRVKSDTISVFSQEDDLLEHDLRGYVSEHIDITLTVDDVNEVGNLGNECEDVGELKDDDNVIHEVSEAVSVEVTNDANDVHDLRGYVSEHIDITLTVDDVNEVGNLGNECEDVGELKDDDNVIHEVSEAVSVEVTNDANDVNDDADVDEVVKKEIIELTYEPRDVSDLIDGSHTQPLDESYTDELCLGFKIPESGQLKEPVSEIENVPSVGEELPQEMVKRTIAEEESKNLITLASPKKLQKATVAKKTTSATNAKTVPASQIRKKISAVTPKLPILSTPKSTKPETTKLTRSTNRLLEKKENGFTPRSSKKTGEPQSKKVVPTSMHMSLSLGPMSSSQTPFMRKSLIMESMADKDIVKRAFKAFQTTPRMSSSSLAKSPAANQSASRKAEPKGSPANTLPKKNEGIGRAAKTATTRTVQQVTKTSLSPGVKKNFGADQRNAKSLAASFGPRVQLQGNSQKEASKKLESKPKFDATQQHSTLKVEKASQFGTQSQNINTKPQRPSNSVLGYGGSVRKV